MKKTAFVALLIFLGTVAGFVWHGSQKSEIPVHPLLIPPTSYQINTDPTLKNKAMKAEIGDRVFEIPIKYIDSKNPKDGVFKDSILLEVIWPDMTTLYDLKDRAEYEQVVRKQKRLGWVLLEPDSKRPSLDEQVENRRRYLTKEEYLGKSYDLEKYAWYDGPEAHPRLNSHTYIEKDINDNILSYVECSKGPNARFPNCRQKFINNTIVYQISYNEKKYLSQWKQIQENAVNFLNSFETDFNDETKEKKS